jgi:bacterioferritin
MQGHDDIIEFLNEVLTAELTSVNQYFVDSKMAANWGYERLAKHFRDESIGEMKDADELIERILYLEGLPISSASAPCVWAKRSPRSCNSRLSSNASRSRG